MGQKAAKEKLIELEKAKKIQKTFSILIFNNTKSLQIMNYKIMIESQATAIGINTNELSLLGLELDSQA